MVPKIEVQGSFAEERQWICPNCETVNTDHICAVCGKARPSQKQGRSQARGSTAQKRWLVPMIAAVFLFVVIAIVAVVVGMRDRGMEKVTDQPLPTTTDSVSTSAPGVPEQAEPTPVPKEGTLRTAEELCTYVLADNGWPASLSVYDKDSGNLIRSAEFTYDSDRIAKITLRDSDGYAIMNRELLYDTDGAAIGHIAVDNRGNSTRYDAGDQSSLEFYHYQEKNAETIIIWNKARQRDYLGIEYDLYGENESNYLRILFTPTGGLYSFRLWENGSLRTYNPDLSLSDIWDYAENADTLETCNVLMLYYDQNELYNVRITDGNYIELPMNYNVRMSLDGAELCSLAKYVLCVRLDNPPEEWQDDENHTAVLSLEDGQSNAVSIPINAEHIGEFGDAFELWAVIDPKSGITASDIKKGSISLYSEEQEICTIS